MEIKDEESKSPAGRRRKSTHCPVCGEKCTLYSSSVISNRLRHNYAQCQNVKCGWTGVFALEAIRTITPPSPAYDASLAPPRMSRDEIGIVRIVP